MKVETRNRVQAEMQRLTQEIHNCAHCQSLRQQLARLAVLLPPPDVEHAGAVYRFVGNPEYNRICEEMVHKLLEKDGEPI